MYSGRLQRNASVVTLSRAVFLKQRWHEIMTDGYCLCMRGVWEPEHKGPGLHCVAWSVVITSLIVLVPSPLFMTTVLRRIELITLFEKFTAQSSPIISGLSRNSASLEARQVP